MTVFKMVKMISPKIPTKMKIPTVMVSVMMKTQTMTETGFLMRRKMKTGLIQKILTQMEMV